MRQSGSRKTPNAVLLDFVPYVWSRRDGATGEK